MKESVRKERDGERRGLGIAPPTGEGGTVLLPKRMNLSTKKNNLRQEPHTPHMAARAPLQAVRSAPRAQNVNAVLDAMAPPLHRQSISERKDFGQKLVAGGIGSRLPVPPQARKGLSFRTPHPPHHPNQPKPWVGSNQGTKLSKPAEQSLPVALAHRVSIATPHSNPTPGDDVSQSSCGDSDQLLGQERFQPANLEMFKSPGEEEFQAPRPSFLQARESLAWVGNLHRQSVHFKELQKQMNENDKRHVNDDDTDSFEAMEKRMKTPVKRVKSKHPQDISDGEAGGKRPLGASDSAEVIKSSVEERGESEHNQYHEEVPEEQLEVFDVLEGNKENVDSVHHGGSEKGAQNCGEKVYKKKHQFFGGGLEVVPSFSPLRQTQSLGCLSTYHQEELEEEGEGEVVPLCRATSNIQLSEGEEVVLSELVPAQQVEQALNELDSQIQELRKVREEQDVLAAKTAEVMLAVQKRRDKFRQLWGVSPLRINTRRTVFPKKVLVEDPVEMDQVEVVVEDSGVTYPSEEVDPTMEDGRLEESYEETGIVPLAMVTPAVNRKVRFNSGHNETHALTPQNHPQEEDEVERTPVAETNGSNQSFAALKTSFAFLATPQAGRTGTPHAARASGNTLRAEATPVALRRLGDRVRDEWAKLYADNSEEEDTLLAPAPLTLKF